MGLFSGILDAIESTPETLLHGAQNVGGAATGFLSDTGDTILHPARELWGQGQEGMGLVGDIPGYVNDALTYSSDQSKRALGNVGYYAERANQYLGDPLGDGDVDWARIKAAHEAGGGRASWEAIVNDNPWIVNAILDIASDPLTYAGGIGEAGKGIRLAQEGGGIMSNVLRGVGRGFEGYGLVGKSPDIALGKAGQGLKAADLYLGGHGADLARGIGDSRVSQGVQAIGDKVSPVYQKYFKDLTTASEARRTSSGRADVAHRAMQAIFPSQAQIERASELSGVPGATPTIGDVYTKDRTLLFHDNPTLTPKELKKSYSDNKKFLTQKIRDMQEGTSEGSTFALQGGKLTELPEGAFHQEFDHVTAVASPGKNGAYKFNVKPNKTTGIAELKVDSKDMNEILNFVNDFSKVPGAHGEKLTFGLYKMGPDSYTFDLGIQTLNEREADVVGSILNQESSYNFRQGDLRATPGGLKNSDSPLKSVDQVKGFLDSLHDVRMTGVDPEEGLAEHGYFAQNGSGITQNPVVPDPMNPGKDLIQLDSGQDKAALDAKYGNFGGLVSIRQDYPAMAKKFSAYIDSPDIEEIAPFLHQANTDAKVQDLLGSLQSRGAASVTDALENAGFRKPLFGPNAMDRPLGRVLGPANPLDTELPIESPFRSIAKGIDQELPVQPENMSIPTLSPEENAALQADKVQGIPLLQRITEDIPRFHEDILDNPWLKGPDGRGIWSSHAPASEKNEVLGKLFEGDPEGLKGAKDLVAKWGRLGVDIANDTDHTMMSNMIAKDTNEVLGYKPKAPSKYKKFQTIWGEIALASPRYVLANLAGNTMDAMIAGRFKFNNVLDYLDIKTAIRVAGADLKGGVDIDLMKETPFGQMFDDYGRSAGHAVYQQTGKANIGSDERTSAIRNTLQKIGGKPLAKLAKVTEGSMAMGYGFDVSARGVFMRDLVDSGFEENSPELLKKLTENVRRGGVSPDSFDLLPTKDPTILLDYYRKMGVSEGYAKRSAQDLATLNNKLFNEAGNKTLKTFLSYDKTKADEFISHFVPFHYWASRKVRWYGEQAMRNPVLLENYVKALDGIQNAQNDPGLDARQKGFLKLLSGPGGFTLLMNPDSLLGVIRASGLQGDKYSGNNGETGFGGILSALKGYGVGLYPWLDGALNMIGSYGDTFEPDMIGIRHRAIVGATVNWLSSEMGVQGPDAFYADLNDKARAQVSSWASLMLPDWLSKPVSVSAGGPISQQSLDHLIENRIIDNNPNLNNAQLAQIMADESSPEYEKAYKEAARSGVIGQLLSFVLPVSIKARDNETDTRAAVTSLTQKEGQRVGISPDDLQYGNVSPEFLAEYKRKTGEEFKPGNYKTDSERKALVSLTPQGRSMSMMDQGYRGIGTPHQQEVYKTYQSLIYGTGKWSGVDSSRISPSQRQILAYNYLNSIPGAQQDMQTVRELQNSYRAQNPDYDQFKNWQSQMYDVQAQFGGDLSKYRQIASQRSPDIAKYFSDKVSYYQSLSLSPEEMKARLDQDTTGIEMYLLAQQGAALRDASPTPGAPTPDPVETLSPPRSYGPDNPPPNYAVGAQSFLGVGQPAYSQGPWTSALQNRQVG